MFLKCYLVIAGNHDTGNRLHGALLRVGLRPLESPPWLGVVWCGSSCPWPRRLRALGAAAAAAGAAATKHLAAVLPAATRLFDL